MQNIQISFFYVDVNFDNIQKSYTFITTNPEAIHNEISNTINNSLVPLSFNIKNQNDYLLKKRKDKIIIQALQQVLAQKSIIRYEGRLPFNSNIHSRSFVKDILFNTNLYQPIDEFEFFLFNHNISKSYYEKKVFFSVDVQREEYSREFGTRQFPKRYDIDRIDYSFLKNGRITSHSDHVYSSYCSETVLGFKGLNDSGKNISITFDKNTKTPDFEKEESINIL